MSDAHATETADITMSGAEQPDIALPIASNGDRPVTDPNSGPRSSARTQAKDRTLAEFLGMMDQYAPIVNWI